jgi:hypothetical protein
MDLIGELDPSENEFVDANLRSTTVERLREQLSGMSLGNFAVRPHRRVVE